MKKFKFSLETVLKVRNQRVKILQRTFFTLSSELDGLRKEEEGMRSELAAVQEEMRLERQRGAWRLMDEYEGYTTLLEGRLADMRAACTSKEKVLAKAQGSLREAIQKRKVVEIIKEKHYSVWRAKHQKEERVALDEIAHHGSPSK